MPLLNTINMKKLREFYSKSPVHQDIITGAFFGILNILMGYLIVKMIVMSNQLYTAYKILIDFIS